MSEKKDPLCDENQFDAFYHEHVQALRNFIYYKFGDAEQADDVTQESFIRLWKNCAKVTLESARGFLYKVAVNLNTSIKRSEKVRLKYTERAIKSNQNHESPEFVILEKEFLERLNSAIER